ncbi:unnamed protein product [Mytilus edulis]|uniref:Fibrinogen C-terminal domain-containing protein n=1 Tax=Mytilus edulis TaxID=6550 RepID=A0A8S3QRX0_MYTED|nr:unnamed protein product [Mytilus edulis]
MKILGSITATGTMKNFAKDTTKTVKLATEIKNMLNGMCTNSKHQNSYEKIDEKVQNISTEKEFCSIVDSISDDKIISQAVMFKLTNQSWEEFECNKNIAQLTSEGNHELRIDVEDWDGNKRYAVYKSFSVGDTSTKYQLTIGKYSGNAGDGMSYFNGMKFSTYDQDNDKHGSTNCADHSTFKGGWWYNNCWNYKNDAILNGHYTHRNNTQQGIIYKSFKKTSLKKSTMKIRKV